MPPKTKFLERAHQPVQEEEERAPVAKGPRLETDEAEPLQPGRPYQAFVESRLRQYMRDDTIHSLVKPSRQEIRAAAMPILCQALRHRGEAGFLPPALKAHMAVNVMHMRAAERGETRKPYNGPYPSADYAEALIQYADDTGLLGREIPLPEHEDPQHPPIYYYIDPITKQPTPRDDAVIRSNYVFDRVGPPLTFADYIHPWPGTGRSCPPREQMEQKGWTACYKLQFNPDGELEVKFYWTLPWTGDRVESSWADSPDIQFTPYPL